MQCRLLLTGQKLISVCIADLRIQECILGASRAICIQAFPLLQAYMELCKKHPSFRERSENADLAVRDSLNCSLVLLVFMHINLSLQPWSGI